MVKIPRWPFDKFGGSDRRITTQMKATGEVMSIDRNFESALMKAMRSLEIGVYGLRGKNTGRLSEMEIEEGLRTPTDERLFVITEALRRGMMLDEIHDLTRVDKWFLHKLEKLVAMETRLRGLHLDDLTPELLRTRQRNGFQRSQHRRTHRR